MPIDFPLSQLPTDLSLEDAVEAAYGDDLDWVAGKLRQNVSTMIECEKQLVPYFYGAVRDRLRDSTGGRALRCRFVSGQADPAAAQQGPQPSLLQLMIRQITEMVRSAEPGTVIVIPHLDLLTTTTRSGLSLEAKEVIALVYENPEVVLLGFKDPEFELPKTVESVFTAKKAVIGIARERLTRLILRREARKFGVDVFDPFALYKYVSGLNVVRLRQILEQFQERMDFDPRTPESRTRIFAEIRDLTRGAELDVPKIDLVKDIGGYAGVKERIEKDILSLLKRRDEAHDAQSVKVLEELIPRGMIFEGPPGTGKTFFAKAIATSIDATAIVVSGPELKSKWVGESESNLRNIFTRARESAPSIIIFDEIDSFATRRGTYTSSGVEHSMVNQLLTEMDGFRKEELVFIIATTNFVESLDEALLRPGRFELKIKIPYPKEKDRRAILDIYAKKFHLELTQEVLDYLVRKTSGYVSVERGVRFSGDHLYAICRGLARERIRKGLEHVLTREDADGIIGDAFEMNAPTSDEHKVIATHECGHAMVAALAPGAARPDKVTIEGDEEDIAPYYTRFDTDHKGIIFTRAEAKARIAVSLGGRTAEALACGDISTGAADDLMKATGLARAMVEAWGMGQTQESCYEQTNEGLRRRRMSESREAQIDHDVQALLAEGEAIAKDILGTNRAVLEDMATVLHEKRVLQLKDLKEFFARHGKAVEWPALPLVLKDKDGKTVELPEEPPASEPAERTKVKRG